MSKLFEGAPEWANYLAVSELGHSTWCELYPQLCETSNNFQGGGRWTISGLKLVDQTTRVISRHAPQPKPWPGPEDGLPPVGIQVEIRNTKNRECSPGSEELFGKSVTVMSAFINMHGYQIVAVEGDDGGCYCFRADMCFAIKTPEQLAAEERDIAIDSMVEEIVGYFEYPKAAEQYLGLATRLHDAGFKREVK